jgi:hypothetical protein
VPILLAVSPFRAIRSAPTMAQSIFPSPKTRAAALSQITVTSIPARESSQLVSRAPWRSGRVSSANTESFFPSSAAA